MREAAFIKQNKEKWIAFEKALESYLKISPDYLLDGYLQLTNDLAYAQTYYPESKTLQYLNNLGVKAHHIIYKNKKEEKNKIFHFFKKDFPKFFYPHLPTLGYTFLFFAFAMLIGAVSTLNDLNFVRLILGDSYVNTTLENIQSGDPTAIYKGGSQIGSFLGITINNIRVAFLAYAFGAIASIGSIYILFTNGIMVGSFVTMFYNEGVFLQANKQIWLHGTLEISVIVIAGCAGIIMGNSFLFPKTRTRGQSFMRGAKDGLKVVVSTIPIFIVAGFIEGFITRYSTMPNWLAFLIIFGSFSFILYYYVLYPILLHRKSESELNFLNLHDISYEQISRTKNP
ncbi:MAG: stage II sporulation protein M [Flavobacteriaceae bacterium]|nr:stage II sporulation protein M [Flavobacteriaceae bacterium]